MRKTLLKNIQILTIYFCHYRLNHKHLETMSCIFLASMSRVYKRVKARDNKHLSPIKTFVQKTKSKSLKVVVKKKLKVQERFVSAKILTKFVISPLLTKNEKSCVTCERSSLGYWTNESVDIVTVSEVGIESSDLTSPTSDDDEYIFHGNKFPIANSC